jgi:hypothetical protein
MTSPGTKSPAALLAAQMFGLLVCVGFPALVTAMAPVSWVKFHRQEGRVTATAKTCLLFVVPFRSSVVESAAHVGRRDVRGTYTRHNRSGRRDVHTKSEDEGFLVIEGASQTAEVPVTPHNLASVIEKSQAFLDDPQATELKMFVVANWKFSVIAGGLVSLLTVLYVVGVLIAGGKGLLRLLGIARPAEPSAK